DSFGRARQSLRADGSVVNVAPADVLGLFPADQTANASSPPTAVTASSAVSTFADPDGNVTTQTLDQRGQVLATADAIGPIHSVTRNPQGLIDTSIDGLSHQTTYGYDDRGNVTSIQDGLAGSFGPVTNYAAAGQAKLQVLTGDLNGDNMPDIVS